MCIRDSTTAIHIDGVESMKGGEHIVIPDRIEAGTYMVASAMTQGDIKVENVLCEHMKPLIAKLREAGCTVCLLYTSCGNDHLP